MIPLKQDILLETGNNELEIIEFIIHGQSYGINVMKVREVVRSLPTTPLPHSHPFIAGIFTVREELLRLVDLGKALGMPSTESLHTNKYLICELNKTKIAFDVHEVVRIHRFSWGSIEPAESFYEGNQSAVIGVVHLEERMILLLDFEKILVDIHPESGITLERVRALGKRERSHEPLMVVEDSKFLQSLLRETLTEAGFTHLTFYPNGEEALAHLRETQAQRPSLVITDIEMPQMDGLTLTKCIKEDPSLRNIPVIVFSSLITDGLRQRALSVGADDQVAKPEIGELVEKIDRLVGKTHG